MGIHLLDAPHFENDFIAIGAKPAMNFGRFRFYQVFFLAVIDSYITPNFSDTCPRSANLSLAIDSRFDD